MDFYFYVFYALFLILLIAGGLFLLFRRRKKVRLVQSLSQTLFRVRMPRYEKEERGKEGEEIKSFIAKMEQIYSSFSHLPKKGIFSQKPRVVLEIASEVGGEDISFYIAVPKELENSLSKLVQGVYPSAVVEKVPGDYTVFEPKGEVAAAYLGLKKTFFYPLTSYKNLEVDPLSPITNALSKILPQEGAALQIVLTLTSFKLKERGDKIISSLREGKSLEGAIAEAGKSPLTKFFDFKDLNKKKEKAEKEERPKPVDQISLEAVQLKSQKPAFDVNIRLVGVAENRERAKDILNNLKSAFGQFSSVFNSFRFKELKGRKLKKLIYNFSFRNFNPKERMVLNIEEIASCYHFPSSQMEQPSVKWTKTKEASPPTELPSGGVILLGKSVYRQEEKPVYFASREDRRRHFYIVGQTGTGKSSLLRELVRQDIENGEGVGVIDPHGELIEETLANIPRERAEEVVLFEPFDMEMPSGLNMLEWRTPEQKDFAVSEMITIFSKLFPPEIIGPMFEHYMRNAMLALMADKENPGTLVEIPRIFVDDNFMKEKLKAVSDPLVKNFWEKEWAQTLGKTKSDMLGYVVSKVGRFVENEMMRNIIGQAHSGFDLEKIMQEGKIFLANLSKGLTGEMNSSLLGLILVSKLQISAMRRSRLREEERRDFYLYIDEFQNFTTDSIATILSEARKYRLNLTLAHQFMPQLTEEIRNAVVGNVGTIGCFRVGAEDAEFLEKQFTPEFSKFDLLNLDNFQFILKMMINNAISSPFKVKTIPPKKGNPEIIDPIKKLSKLKYSRSKEVVEEEILKRSKLGEF